MFGDAPLNLLNRDRVPGFLLQNIFEKVLNNLIGQYACRSVTQRKPPA
jgi:hypothetical protein